MREKELPVKVEKVKLKRRPRNHLKQGTFLDICLNSCAISLSIMKCTCRASLSLGFQMVIMAKRPVEILESGCDFKGKCELF